MKSLEEVRAEHLAQAERAVLGLPVLPRLAASPAFRALVERIRASRVDKPA